MNPLKLTRKPVARESLERDIEVITRVIRNEIGPAALYLFGSAAEGKITDQSDFDLLVVCDSETELKQARRRFSSVRSALPPRSYDVVWLTRQEFDRKSVSGGVAFVARKEGRRLL